MADHRERITSQPNTHQSTSNPFLPPTMQWSVGLYDCCSDAKECCYACVCPLCFMHSLGNSINEKSIWDCCIPSRVGIYRMKIRSMLHIEGTAMEDCCAVTFCGSCAALQMKLELKSRGLA